jgi:hypothetical protein
VPFFYVQTTKVTTRKKWGSGGFEPFLRPGEAERLRRVNRHGGRFSKKGGPEDRSKEAEGRRANPSLPIKAAQ